MSVRIGGGGGGGGHCHCANPRFYPFICLRPIKTQWTISIEIKSWNEEKRGNDIAVVIEAFRTMLPLSLSSPSLLYRLLLLLLLPFVNKLLIFVVSFRFVFFAIVQKKSISWKCHRILLSCCPKVIWRRGEDTRRETIEHAKVLKALQLKAPPQIHSPKINIEIPEVRPLAHTHRARKKPSQPASQIVCRLIGKFEEEWHRAWAPNRVSENGVWCVCVAKGINIS